MIKPKMMGQKLWTVVDALALVIMKVDGKTSVEIAEILDRPIRSVEWKSSTIAQLNSAEKFCSEMGVEYTRHSFDLLKQKAQEFIRDNDEQYLLDRVDLLSRENQNLTNRLDEIKEKMRDNTKQYKETIDKLKTLREIKKRRKR